MRGTPRDHKMGTVSAGFKAKPAVKKLRNQMKYKISTTSTTASGVVPINGATKYPEEPSIYFTREAWVKQCHLVHKCSKEVGWFALVDYDEADNSFTITEIVIPCQEVTAAETDIGKEDLADAAMELIEAGKDTSKMYAWFHSHVNMGVGPSGQDEYQVEDFLEDLADQPEVPAFIRGIQNKKGDLKIDVYYIQHGIAYQNVDFNVIHDDDPQWLTDIEIQIKTKVTERVYPQQGFGGYPAREKNHSAYDWRSEGLRDPANSWHGYYKDYDDNDYDYNKVGSTVVGDGDTDIPNIPQPLNSMYSDDSYLDMDLVYQSPLNMEVLSDNEGRLWVCDEKGDMYDYAEYTEAYGEVDGGTTPANTYELL